MIHSTLTAARPRALSPRLLGLAPVALVVALSLALLIFMVGAMCPDVSGQFWIAHMMRGGVWLYVDFIEMNPPLWFWMAMPIDWAAEVTGIRYEVLTIVVVALTVIGATRAIARLLPFDARHRSLFLLYLVAVVMIMPARAFEQREHLALIAGLPYFILAAARREGRAVSMRLALLVGLGAGIGLSLKPHFLAGPMLVEAWLLLTLRRAWRPIRPETLALAAAVLSYLAAIAWFTPAYLTHILPDLLSSYQAASPSLKDMIRSPTPTIWAVLLGGFLALRTRAADSHAPVTVALLLGAAGFAVAWALQHKGWLYQGLPTTGCLAMALAAWLIERGIAPGKAARVFLPALLALPLAIATLDTEPPITPANDIAPALADLKRGDAFALVSTAGATSWPALVDRGLVMSSRYGQYWMLRLLDRQPPDPRAMTLAKRAVAETADDYRCLPPQVILFVRPGRFTHHDRVSDNPFPFFMGDPAFAEVMTHYRPARSGPIYDSYRLVRPFAPFDRSRCRHSG